jgi:hypothetical protein
MSLMVTLLLLLPNLVCDYYDIGGPLSPWSSGLCFILSLKKIYIYKTSTTRRLVKRTFNQLSKWSRISLSLTTLLSIWKDVLALCFMPPVLHLHHQKEEWSCGQGPHLRTWVSPFYPSPVRIIDFPTEALHNKAASTQVSWVISWG